MLNKRSYRLTELSVLFVILPVFLTSTAPNYIKFFTVTLGIIYCFWISIKLKLIPLKSLYEIQLYPYLKRFALTFLFIVITTIIFVYVSQPENLFIVVKKKPLLWLAILLVYSVLSVYPQELLYRGFFFNRYHQLFQKNNYLITINILVFPLAHLLFKNELVLLVTLIGGTIFTFTYYHSKSILLTSLEHALYGNWLFTVGMGEMLAFPMPK